MLARTTHAWSDRHVGLADNDVIFKQTPSPCWELCRRAYHQERGETLPALSAGDGWKLVPPEDAQDFDLVLFRHGTVDAHVGLIAGGPWQMLHLPERRRDGAVAELSVVERFDNGTFLPRLVGVYRREPQTHVPWSAPRDAHLDSVTLIDVPFVNPATDTRVSHVRPGQNLLELVQCLHPAAREAHMRRMVVVVGRPDLPVDQWSAFGYESWALIRPKAGRIVCVSPYPGAFNLGRVFGLLAVSAALAAGQFWLGPLLATQLGFTAGTFAFNATVFATTAVLAGATQFAVSKLFPTGSEQTKGATAAVGFQNRLALREAVPNPIGKIRSAPPFAAFPYVSLKLLNEQDRSDQVMLHALFIEAIGDGVVTDRRFGYTELDKFDDGDNYVQVEEGLINPGDPWPFTAYDHQVVPTEASSLGIEFRGPDDSTPFYTRGLARDITAIEVMLRFGGGLYSTDSSGNINGSTVKFEWWYAPASVTIDPPGAGWIQLDWTELRKEYKGTFYAGRKWDVPRGDYQIAHRKTGSEDFETDSSQGDYTWIILQGHRPEPPFSCRVPVYATAFFIRSTDQLQGTIAAYNRVFSRKALDWESGAWVYKETQNPASGVRYLLQSPALAKPYTDDELNLDKFAEWHEHCEAQGLAANFVGDQKRPLRDAVNEYAAAGRAVMRNFNGPWEPVIDRPRTEVVGHLGPKNGWAISKRVDRLVDANGFTCEFLDESTDYATKTAIVPFDGYTESQVTKPIALTIPGATLFRQVYREAKRREYLAYQSRFIEYQASASWDHMTLHPEGMVILDDGLSRDRVQALVTAVNGNRVELSEEFTMRAGQTYKIRWRRLPAAADEGADPPPMVDEVRTLATVVGTSNTVVLAGTGLVPEVDDLAMVGLAADYGIEAILERVGGGDDLVGQLILRDAANDVDARVDALVVPDWNGRVGAIPGEDADPPENVQASVMITYNGAEIQPYVRISWDNVPGEPMQAGWRRVGDTNWSTVDVAPDVDEGVSSLLSNDDSYEVSARVRNGNWADPVTVVPEALLLADAGVLALADADSLEQAS